MIGSFSSSLSGLDAAATRFDVAASNIVNALDTSPYQPPNVAPVAPAQANQGNSFQPHDVVQTTTADGGTRADVVDRQPATQQPAYMPDDPNANQQGLVSRPNVDDASEFVNIIFAQRAYEASIKAIQTRDQVLGVTIDARS